MGAVRGQDMKTRCQGGKNETETRKTAVTWGAACNGYAGAVRGKKRAGKPTAGSTPSWRHCSLPEHAGAATDCRHRQQRAG